MGDAGGVAEAVADHGASIVALECGLESFRAEHGASITALQCVVETGRAEQGARMAALESDLEVSRAEQGANIAALHDGLTACRSEQGASILALQSSLEACRTELQALRACLSRCGVLTAERVLAQQHRHCFEHACAVHGLHCEASLDVALSERGIALAAGSLAGPLAVEAVASASRGLAASAREVLCEVRASCPCHFYLCGGGTLDQPSNTVERFSSATGLWEVLPPMAEARWMPAAAAVGGRLFFCGGGDGSVAFASVQVFDPTLGTWQAAAPMLVARYSACAGAVSGRLYVCGGEGSGEDVMASAERFTAEAVTLVGGDVVLPGAWARLPDMLERRADSAGACLLGVMYVCGGTDDEQNVLRSVERFDEVVGDWGAGPPMLQPRGGACAAVVGAARRPRLCVCGGKAGPQERLSSAECLDPLAGAWEAVAPLSVERAGAAAAAFAGSVYVFGGFCGAEVLHSVEMLAVDSAQEWVFLPPMSQGRWGAAAVALLDR